MAWLATVLSLTLHVGDIGLPTPSLRRFLCIACETTAGADIILNWVLFLPGGLLLGILLGPRRATVLCLLLSLGVESLQVFTPGRDPAAHDLISNTIGAWTGAYLILGPWSRAKRLTLAGLAVTTWLLPAVLLVPQVREGRIHNGWTPNRGGYELYGGEVLGSSLGALGLEPGWLPDTEAVRERIDGRAPITTTFRAGPRPEGVSPLVILARGRVEQLVVAIHQDDVLFSTYSVARRFRLKQPAFVGYGAMRGVDQGAVTSVVVDRARSSGCIGVGSRESCSLAPSLADGWSFLLGGQALGAIPRRVMGVVWALLIGAGMSLALGGTQGRLLGLMTSLAGLVVSAAAPDVRPELLSAAVLALAATAAPVVQPWLTRTAGAFQAVEPLR